jgi:sugar fermentation stimulation protein A
MRFPRPLQPARLIRRYKRFLADFVLADGRAVTAHCPNPGAMLGLAMPGLQTFLLESDAPTRRLPLSLELVRLPSGLVGINTGRPNGLAAEAIAAGRITPLTGYPRIRREVAYGTRSRVDMVLEGDDGRPPCYVEVKNVHFRRPEGAHPTAAEFPDCRTARGLRHLAELTAVRAAGARAVMLFLVQRGDCDHFRVAGDIDPAYAAGLCAAAEAGVEVHCWDCRVGLEAIDVDKPLPVVL